MNGSGDSMHRTWVIGIRHKDCNIGIDRVQTAANWGCFRNLKPPPVPLIDAAVI